MIQRDSEIIIVTNRCSDHISAANTMVATIDVRYANGTGEFEPGDRVTGTVVITSAEPLKCKGECLKLAGNDLQPTYDLNKWKV